MTRTYDIEDDISSMFAAGAISMALMSDLTMNVHIVREDGVETGELDVQIPFLVEGRQWHRLKIELSPDQHGGEVIG